MNFGNWLEKKYVEWRGDRTGQGISESAFAREIGISTSTFNTWKNGERMPTDDKSIRVLADYFGPEIFDVLEIREASYGLDLVPEPFRSSVRRVIHALVSGHVGFSNEEAKQIAQEILELEIKKRNK